MSNYTPAALKSYIYFSSQENGTSPTFFSLPEVKNKGKKK